ncbi:hypothetical protein GA0115236_104418, partial [Streptomyces sp. IgraMP-1]
MADSTGQEPTEPGHTGAVAADPYDRIAWRDLYARSAALRELAAELAARHAHTTDLLADAFLAAYLAAPRVREAAETGPLPALQPRGRRGTGRLPGLRRPAPRDGRRPVRGRPGRTGRGPGPAAA